MAVATASPVMMSLPVSAQNAVPTLLSSTSKTTFSDIKADYWARPFIQAIVERNIIDGFADGTFRPDRPVKRAEFAVMLQKAFEQKRIRQLNASGFKDVPSNYWAASAIKEAYETGFMPGYPANLFLPKQEVGKFEAIAALANGLGLTATAPASNILNGYYTDAPIIPNYAADAIAAATQANLVVNYPNVKRLDPLEPLTRASAAALLYQALVWQERVEPLPSNITTANYVVAQAVNASRNNLTTLPDVVTVTASDASFSILTSLLKTAGLTVILQHPNNSLTMFAPTDEAFAKLPEGTLEWLQQPENRETLIRVLTYHVIPRKRQISELSEGKLKTFAGKAVNIEINSLTHQTMVNNAKILQSNIQASNGIIHVINQVLIPPNINLSRK
ncbi:MULTISPECIES: fasciclin domain-containing protein [Nostocales]|uniref:Beta-Ig-H3/fasciclin n=3 Tax=Nostocales TaxID=1161 RepID=A0A8S9T1D3_9CYAN|nr:fasciclin domain-containing protein [Tolypothrix bouteillei]KAF3885372.1 hypothetical protein DA73_0400007795 [Tolypothrix bouteillei VB521301]